MAVFRLLVFLFLQATSVLWYPLSPVAALWFVASACASYLAGVYRLWLAGLADESLAPSFRRHAASKQTIDSK